jgi:RsiW-degrading membrane proteinase PrsW (M82 family)
MRYFLPLIISIVPLVLYSLIIKSTDKNEHESLKFVFKNFFFGALVALILVMITGIILAEGFIHLTINPNEAQSAITLIYAPLIEEIVKGLILFLMLRTKNLYSLTDGLIYGGAVGLGFGMIENILYFITIETSDQSWFLFVISRTFFLSVMHFVTTSLFGAFLVFLLFKDMPLKIYILITGMFGSIMIHFSWNFITERYGITVIPGFLFLTFEVVIFIFLFITLLHIESKFIYREMIEETQNNLIPYGHLEVLRQRIQNKCWWIDKNIRKEYLRSIKILALGKLQLKKQSNDRKKALTGEIELQREKIKKLLAN